MEEELLHAGMNDRQDTPKSAPPRGQEELGLNEDTYVDQRTPWKGAAERAMAH